MSRHPSRLLAATVSIPLVGAILLRSGAALGSTPSADPAVPASVPPESAAPGSPMAGLRVEGAWARVSLMVERAGAAYMIIHSGSPVDDALVGATSPAAAVVELHVTEADASGMMSMHQVPEIVVPAGGTVELAPGGYHLMLIDLVAPLEDRTSVELVLMFRSGATITVEARVGEGAPIASPGAMGSAGPGSPAPMGSATP